MDHQEIRFRILFTLYLRHYSDQLGHPQVTTEVIKEAGLDYIEDKNQIYGDIVYLKESNLVKGTDVLGTSYPFTLMITNKGIDFMDGILPKFVEFLRANEKIKSDFPQTLILTDNALLRHVRWLMDQMPDIYARFLENQRKSVP